MHEYVAGIDVHKDMIKVAVRSPGKKKWTRKTEILTYKTFYGVLRVMARDLRARGVTHVAMEASGVYTDPVYYALAEEDFEEILVVNPLHVKAVRGQKTDAKDSARIAELLECGLLQGSYMPPPELRELRDLTRYRVKTVQARSSETQRLAKTLETAGIKLGSVASDITGVGPMMMIGQLIDGERRGEVMADLAIGRARSRIPDLSMALEGRFSEHHAMLCRLHLDRIRDYREAVRDLDQRIAAAASAWQDTIELLKTIPGFGDITARTWIAEIGPAPHEWFATSAKLAAWSGLAPGNYVSAGKRRYGRTGPSGTWIKPVLVEAAWSAVRTPGRLQARYHALVRRMGGAKNPAARKKAIVAIAHTLLRIAYAILKSGQPYEEPGEDFYARREDPSRRQAWLEAQLQKLHPGCAVTVTVTPHPDAPGTPGSPEGTRDHPRSGPPGLSPPAFRKALKVPGPGEPPPGGLIPREPPPPAA